MIVVNTADFAQEGLGDFYTGRWEQATVSAAGDWILIPTYDFKNRLLGWPQSNGPKTESDFDVFQGYTFYKGPLPDGVVHGFGILIDNRRRGNFWMDNYTILGVDETPGPPVAPTLSINLEGDDVRVSFESAGDRNYQLLKSSGSLDSFVEAGDPEPGNDAVKTLVDPNGRPAAGNNVFYRVQVSDGS